MATEARPTCRDRLEEYFLKAGIPYEIQEHAAAYTARQVAASEHLSPKLVAKVVIVVAGEQPVMLVLPAAAQVNMIAVRSVLGAQLVRLAREDELQQLFPDCEVGAMPPFGNLYGIPVYVDPELTKDETLYFQVGTHTETMSVRYEDYARLVQPHVMDMAHHVTSAPFSVAGVVGR